MMISIILFALVLSVETQVAKSTVLTNNDHVVTELNVTKKISLSKSGDLSVRFTPNDGIHINTEPMFEVVLDKSSVFEISGNPRFKSSDKEYLDHSHPVVYTLKAKKGTAPGTHRLTGKVMYFYCSDADGWCNRFVQPFDISVEISK
jgi:hypothetical protein